MAANNIMTMQGQPCLIVDHLKPNDDPVGARCVARPSVDESFGERLSTEKYDVTVLREHKMRPSDQVHLLDELGEVEMILEITKPEHTKTALRVYIAVPKPLPKIVPSFPAELGSIADPVIQAIDLGSIHDPVIDKIDLGSIHDPVIDKIELGKL